MKILFDHQIFSIQRYGGASKYFCELLKKIPRDNWETTTFISNNEYLKNAGLFPYFNFMPSLYFKGKARLMENLNRPYSIYKLGHSDYDIFHQTHFTTDYLKSVGKRKMVVTFHDMNPVKNVELYKKSIRINIPRIVMLQKECVQRADKIIAVSQNTKKDLVDIWNINPEKVIVIHHGIEKSCIPSLNNERIVPNPYILYVGVRDGFKNFNRFLNAYRIVHKFYPDLMLICTGTKFSDEEISILAKNNILNKVKQISADELIMAMLYRDAMMFVYPSIYEGFGMPILEAMQYGCPVILSNTSSFPEIAGDAGLYFDPLNVEDIVEKIKLLINNNTLRQIKVALGYERLKWFSWAKTAQEHIDLYRSLL